MSTQKRFYGPAALTNAAATKYTVPANVKAILRHIHVANPSANPVDFTLSIGADAAATRLWDGYPIPADSYEDFFLYTPMDAAEIIQALGSVNAILVITISGDVEAV